MAESAVDQHGPTATKHTHSVSLAVKVYAVSSHIQGLFLNLKTSILSIIICSIEQENNLGLCYWRASWIKM